MKYYIIVYGCQMNISDSERIRTILDNAGFREVKKESEADLIIIVACSIRQSAINRIYGKIQDFNRYKKKNPNFKTIITGCILTKDKKIFLTKFDFVIDIKEIEKIPDLLKDKVKKVDQNCLSLDYLKIDPKQTNKFSATVPIMTGCDNYCTYCVVPYVRGNKQSRPVEDILKEIQFLINNNYKEIWLLGQNVNDYNSEHQDEKYSFAKLLEKIDNIVSLSSQKIWIRFTSPHPKNFSDELIEVMAKGKNIANYLNLPLQSGDNEILKKMNRSYTIGEYKKLVKKIRIKIPDIALSTDLILGFPGETEEKFQNTLKAVQEIEFDMIYINQYSARSGTAAEKFKDQVSQKEKKRRWEILNKELVKINYKKNQKYLNKTVEVLIDSFVKDNYLGKTRDYKTVKIEKESEYPKCFTPLEMTVAKGNLSLTGLIGNFVKVKITEIQSFGLSGKIIKKFTCSVK